MNTEQISSEKKLRQSGGKGGITCRTMSHDAFRPMSYTQVTTMTSLDTRRLCLGGLGGSGGSAGCVWGGLCLWGPWLWGPCHSEQRIETRAGSWGLKEHYAAGRLPHSVVSCCNTLSHSWAQSMGSIRRCCMRGREGMNVT